MEIDFDEILKVLSNPCRRRMLAWLKEPDKHFAMPHPAHAACEGVCVGRIVEKTGLSQSTVSAYMDALLRAGLVSSERRGQWTFYKRNEEVIAAFIAALGAEM